MVKIKFSQFRTFISLLIITILIILLFGCTETKSDEFVYDIDMRIVSINNDEVALSQDKFRRPQLCNSILLETIKEPKLYREFNTCNHQGLNRIKIFSDKAWFYNHDIGDIIHFDYLVKSEFFEIKKRND